MRPSWINYGSLCYNKQILMDQTPYTHIIGKQRAFFSAGRTRDPSFRMDQLTILRKAIVNNEDAIFAALAKDLGKPLIEAYGGDTAIVLREIDYAIKHLALWSRPKKVRTILAHQPATSVIIPEPYGVVLIISPWNFPVQLSLTPLVGALAAGNCVVLKPSPLAPETSRLIETIIQNNFDPAYAAAVAGGADAARALLDEPFDYIFFTGGSATGRQVMTAAAARLTPVTLELGGKNPCIVDSDVDLDVASRRIAWGKFFNAGQSCVAVDYLLAHSSVKRELIGLIGKRIREFYGDDPERSPDFGRIVNEAHVDRLAKLLDRGVIAAGGRVNREDRYIAPTVIDDITGDDPIMADEIFGPLLPVIGYDDPAQAIAFVNARPKPLTIYIFSRGRRFQERVLRETASGGACINETVLQETSTHLPFGGVGLSGIGRYHGKASFDTFTYPRSVIKKGFWLDIGLRYPPYRDRLKWFRKIF